jgi:Gpi18-like mannosyltransferase
VERKEVLAISVLIVLFILSSVFFFDKGRYTFDVRIMQQWGNVALNESVASLYVQDVSFSERKTTYPPLYLYVLEFNSWLSLKLFNDNTPLSTHYAVISKSVPTLCNLLIGLSIWFFVRKYDSRSALIAMCLYLFNPAVIYNASYWGQIDSVNALFMVISVIFLVRKRFALSSIFITLAILTKIQSIVLLPVVAIVLLKECDWKKIVKSVCACIFLTIVIIFPIVRTGFFGKMLNTLFASVGFAPLATVNAHNLWYLVAPGLPDNWGNLTPDTQTIFGITYKMIGLTALGLFTLAVLYLLWKKCDEQTIIFSASSMALGFFMLPTQIHERYLFPFFGLFALGMMSKKRYVLLYVLFMITFLLNLMWALPAAKSMVGFYQIQQLLNLAYRHSSVMLVGVLVSSANILLFALYVKEVILANIKRSMNKLNL